MFCSQCGKPVRDDDKFCSNCGSPITHTEPVKEPMKELIENPDLSISQTDVDSIKQETLPTSEAQKETAPAYDYRSLPTEEATGIRKIYFIDFLLGLTGKSNIPLCIYLILNVIIIGLIASLFLQLPIFWGMISGILLYIGSIAIAVSPIGEAILRHQTGCKKITDPDIVNRLEPLFREVYYKAKKENPTISNDVRLFINEEMSANAFATGRKTMCITRGFLSYSDEEIKATMGHEFGHLAHKDTDRILVISIGNTVISAICLFFQFGALLMQTFSAIFAAITNDEDGLFAAFMGMLSSFITMVLISTFQKIWTKLGVLLCMKSSRDNEYLADEFSFKLGYGDTLCQVLNTFRGEKPKGLFANLASSHPDSLDRIERLKALGATYEIRD